MRSNRKLINNSYWSFYQNKNLANLIKIYNIKFSREKIQNNASILLDQIAYKYYGDENLWWVIAIFNDIVDPFNDLNNKKELIIPLNVKEYIDKL